MPTPSFKCGRRVAHPCGLPSITGATPAFWHCGPCHPRSFGAVLSMTFTSKKKRGDHNNQAQQNPSVFLGIFFSLRIIATTKSPPPLVIVHTIFFRQKCVCVCQWLPPNAKEKKTKKNSNNQQARLTHLQTFPEECVTQLFFGSLEDDTKARWLECKKQLEAYSSLGVFGLKFPQRLGFWLWKNGEVFFGKPDLWIIVKRHEISPAPPNLANPYGFLFELFPSIQ